MMDSRHSHQKGRLDQTDVATVLQQLQEAGDAGALILRGEQRGVMVVDPPYINLVTTAEDRLGADLIAADIVDESTWEAALEGGARVPGGAIRALLKGGVDSSRLRLALYDHFITALFELLVPGDTEFEFLPGVSHRLSVDPGFMYDDVLSDLNTRVGVWRQIAEAIPSTDYLARRLGELPVNIPSVTLNRFEYELLWRLDPQTTVAEIIAATERPAFEVMTQLYELWRRGLIEIEEPSDDL